MKIIPILDHKGFHEGSAYKMICECGTEIIFRARQRGTGTSIAIYGSIPALINGLINWNLGIVERHSPNSYVAMKAFRNIESLREWLAALGSQAKKVG